MSFSWLKYWCEGFVLLSIILVGTAANFFSVIIIRNRELSLVQVNDSLSCIRYSIRYRVSSSLNITTLLISLPPKIWKRNVEYFFVK